MTNTLASSLSDVKFCHTLVLLFFLLCTECSFGTQSHGRLAVGQGVGEEPHQSPAAPQGGPASALLGLPLRQPAASRRRDLRHMRVRPECGGMQGESVCSWQVLTPYNSVLSGRGESVGCSRTLEGDVQIPDHSRSKISPARLCGAFLLFPALCHRAPLKACCWENYHSALSGDWLACRRMTDCKQHCIFMVFAVRRSQNWDLVLFIAPVVCVSSILFWRGTQFWSSVAMFSAWLTDMTLRLLCFIDRAATRHYTEQGSADALRSVAEPGPLPCGRPSVSGTADLPTVSSACCQLTCVSRLVGGCPRPPSPPHPPHPPLLQQCLCCTLMQSNGSAARCCP